MDSLMTFLINSLIRYLMASDELPHPLMASDELPHQVPRARDAAAAGL